jgi:surface protein
MFRECSSLSALNLSKFNTKKVEYMSYMFYKCSALTELNLSAFNTEKVEDMSWMFEDCSCLEKLNLGSFNFTSVDSVRKMFSGCSVLKTFVIPQQLLYNNENDVDFNGVFKNCNKLKINDSFNIGAISTFDEFISVLKNNS